ncbi:unnamed protein product [Leptidea sinapis]|uniref:Uncharacterized protein n=1 Tax=Leptidea sinapis TaxID=189913 RepID=A0A5E4PQA3_9NEOP|nr:unnamed protein product [Leptidea sinapis]
MCVVCQSLDRTSASSAGSAGAGAGRVRAALRPGPDLHHHPPDFLDNLRETQRQRLGAPPRAPPPLPPKPPTLV